MPDNPNHSDVSSDLHGFKGASKAACSRSPAEFTQMPSNHETWAQGLLLLYLFHIVCHVLNCWPPTLITQHSSTLCQPTCQSIEVKVFQHGMHATHERSTLTPLCNKRPLPVEFERRDGFEREAFPPSLSWVELRAEAVSWVVQKSSTKITFCENAARDKK